MWKDYSADYIRRNRASSVSIMVAAFIASLFLSLLCSLFYNFWIYEIEQIIREEGSWQARIAGEMEEADLLAIEGFANVEKAVVNEELSDGQTLVVDLCFRNMRTIYGDAPLIAEELGLEAQDISYHELLLSRYLIHDPQDQQPPLLMAFYLMILLIVSVSLVLIIHNSFGVSMNERVRQFGIFASVGATPKQIRTCLMQEAAALCTVPILLGNAVGILLCMGTIRIVNLLGADIAGRHQAVFTYHPLVLLAAILTAALTVSVSAWIPAGKLSRLTPLEAIRGEGEWCLKKNRRAFVLPLLFGVEGELARNALKAQKKALRTSNLSLTLSFLGFTLMLCFFSLSHISTDHTYFEKYQNAWDVMVTVKDTRIESFQAGEKIRNMEGVRSCAVYQKADAVCRISKECISEELSALGGLEAVAGDLAADKDSCLVQAPLIIMDDESFREYCGQIGIAPRADGCIVLNRIWDSVHSNFRYREYVPYIKESSDTMILQEAGQNETPVEIPVLAYTQDMPLLREEYDDYALVQVIPLSVWEQMADQIGNVETDTYVRLLGKEDVSLAELERLEENILQSVGGRYELVIENRIRERQVNDQMLQGFMLILGALCVLLAMIGIANVFSNTLGFLRQRKREFARYMSIGMTVESMRKMFFIEALVIAGRPLLVTALLSVVSVGVLIKASYLDPLEFLVRAPILPILAFYLAVAGFVGLAYYIGGKRILRCNLAETLRL